VHMHIIMSAAPFSSQAVIAVIALCFIFHSWHVVSETLVD